MKNAHCFPWIVGYMLNSMFPLERHGYHSNTLRIDVSTWRYGITWKVLVDGDVGEHALNSPNYYSRMS
jgi:hypothetical protein